MAFLLSLGRRLFRPPKPQVQHHNWKPEGVTKEEILRIFARELQRKTKVEG